MKRLKVHRPTHRPMHRQTHRPTHRAIPRVTRSVTGALFLLSALFGVAFVADLRGYFNIPDHPIAVLLDANGTVRRLADKGLTWDRAESGTLFAQKDTVSTGEGTNARLVFYAGGEMELGPGSMVYLGGDLDELELNFVSGSARVRVAKSARKKIKIASAPTATPSRLRVETVDADRIAEVKPPTQDELKKGKLAAAPQPGKPTSTERTLPARQMMITRVVQEHRIRNPDAVLFSGGAVLTQSVAPPAPEIVFPPPEAIIDISRQPLAGLRWKMPDTKDIKGAKDRWRGEDQHVVRSYEVLIRPVEKDEREAMPVILRSTTPHLPFARVGAVVGTGRFKWSVRAVNTRGKRSPGAPARVFTVKKSANLKRPTILPVKIR